MIRVQRGVVVWPSEATFARTHSGEEESESSDRRFREHVGKLENRTTRIKIGDVKGSGSVSFPCLCSWAFIAECVGTGI